MKLTKSKINPICYDLEGDPASVSVRIAVHAGHAATRKEIEQEIVDACNSHAALTDENAKLRADLNAVNELAREFGYGQGELDTDLAGCLRKSCDDLRAEVERLKSQKCGHDTAKEYSRQAQESPDA